MAFRIPLGSAEDKFRPGGYPRNMPPRARRIRKSYGGTLVEMIISILILATAVTAMAIGLINGPAQFANLQHKERMALAANGLLQELKNYVTADAAPVLGAPGDLDALGRGTWHLPGDNCPDNSYRCWALAPGTHDGSSFLPADLKAAPYNAKLLYTVTMVAGLPKVDATVTWEEPKQ